MDGEVHEKTNGEEWRWMDGELAMVKVMEKVDGLRWRYLCPSVFSVSFVFAIVRSILVIETSGQQAKRLCCEGHSFVHPVRKALKHASAKTKPGICCMNDEW